MRVNCEPSSLFVTPHFYSITSVLQHTLIGLSLFRAGIIIVIILLILWIAIDTAKDVKRLVSFAGLAIYILIGYIFSKHRSRVSILLPFCIPINDPCQTSGTAP